VCDPDLVLLAQLGAVLGYVAIDGFGEGSAAVVLEELLQRDLDDLAVLHAKVLGGSIGLMTQSGRE